MARRSGAPISRYLLPMAFASLLGGLMTLVGVAQRDRRRSLREELASERVRRSMFDYLPVGAALAAGWRSSRWAIASCRAGEAVAAMGGREALDEQAYLSEARVVPGSAAERKSIAELGGAAEGVSVTSGACAGRTGSELGRHWCMKAGDIDALLEGAPAAQACDRQG